MLKRRDISKDRARDTIDFIDNGKSSFTLRM